jgi:phosphonate transport system substrate-binding protein
MERMIERKMFDRSAVRIIWESDQFPGSAYGYTYNLYPDLQKKVREAFLTFDWKGTGLGKEFGKQAQVFVPVDYKKHWDIIRLIQKDNKEAYTMDALKKVK